MAAKSRPSPAALLCGAQHGDETVTRFGRSCSLRGCRSARLQRGRSEVVEHVVDRDERQPGCLTDSSKAASAGIVTAIDCWHGEIRAALKFRCNAAAKSPCHRFGTARPRRSAVAVRNHIGIWRCTRSWGRRPCRGSNRVSAVGRAILDRRRLVRRRDRAAADDEPEPDLFAA